jgi:glutathione reductase (NADPH)
LAAELQATGLQLRTGLELSSLARSGSAISVQLSDGSTTEVDCVLQALGRKPNTDGLGLSQAGLQLDAKGAIAVDEWSRTNVPHVYAVGDVTNRVNLTPMAIREGHAFADTVFGQRPRKVDHTLIPTAVFTTPEVGTVGLSEAQALQSHPQLDVYSSRFRPMKATLSGSASQTFFKLLVDRQTDRVLGFHAIGEGTGEMVQLVAIALHMKATKADFDATLAVHPTASEELVTMRTPALRHGWPTVASGQ